MFSQSDFSLESNTSVGGVTHNSARFRVHLNGAASVNIRASHSTGSPVSGIPVKTDSTNNYTAIINVNNLLPSTKYNYEVLVNGTRLDNIGRSFTTFPVPGSNEDFSFVFGSCQENSGEGEIFDEIVKYEPAFFLHLGDWTYPDSTEDLPWDMDFFPTDYKRVLDTYKYKYNLETPIDTLLRSTPVAYIYDDHDYMNNNSSALTVSYALPFRPNNLSDDFVMSELAVPPQARLNSIRGFIENTPDYPVENSSRGIYRKFTYGSAEFYMLDLRSQRSPVLNSVVKNNSKGKWEFIQPENHSILGNSASPGNDENQFSWLIRNLGESTAKWKFLVSSVPLNRGQLKAIDLGIEFQDTAFSIPGSSATVNAMALPMELADKWVGYINELDKLLEFIRVNNISNVFVLSGDSHTSAMDDGTNAGLPEIMSGNLDIRNSRTAAALDLIGVKIWNKGGQGITTDNLNNAFGYIQVYGIDSVKFTILDQEGERISRMVIHDQGNLDISGLNFTASAEGGRVKIIWSIESTEIKSFEVQKSEDGIIFEKIADIQYSGDSYVFSDYYTGGTFYYRLKIIGKNSSFKFSETVRISDIIPDDFYMTQNFPNPFNSSTRINFGITQDEKVTISIYNIIGERMRLLLDEYLPAGEHFVAFEADDLPSGVYFYRITAGSYSDIKKMVLLK